MKTKLICLLSALLFLSLLLCSCGETPPDIPTPSKEKTVYETLSELMNNISNSMTITVKSFKNGQTLESRYEVSESNGKQVISYSCEEYALFEVNTNGITVPDASKTVRSGSVIVSNGKIEKWNGDIVDISLEKVSAPTLSFDEKNFQQIKIENGKFSADVTDISAFCGWKNDAKNMKVAITYSSSMIMDIVISYCSASGAQFTAQYHFN